MSPTGTTHRKGYAGGYHYRRVQVVGDERYQDKPDKNAYNHPHGALQYLPAGSGEGRAILGREQRATEACHPMQAEPDYDVFGY